MKPTEEYSACVDCYFTVANGEVPDDCERPKRVRAAVAALGPQAVTMDEEAEQHAEFSWSPCEVCGSTLGGAREGGHKAVEVHGEETRP